MDNLSAASASGGSTSFPTSAGRTTARTDSEVWATEGRLFPSGEDETGRSHGAKGGGFVVDCVDGGGGSADDADVGGEGGDDRGGREDLDGTVRRANGSDVDGGGIDGV